MLKVMPWDPLKLPRIDGKAAEWSRGFLRCAPLRWFPDLDREFHSFCVNLGWEASIQRLEPSLQLPSYAQERLLLVAQGEPLALVMEKQAAAQLGELFMESPVPVIRQQGVQYLGRRLVARMARSWVGGGDQQLRLFVDQDQIVRDDSWVGSIQFSLRINARSFEGAFLVGPRIMGLLDGLWRRQLRSGTQSDITAGPLLVALGEVRVPPLDLPQLLSPGTQIRFEGYGRGELGRGDLGKGEGSARGPRAAEERSRASYEEAGYLMKSNGARMRVALQLGDSHDFLVLRSATSSPVTGRGLQAVSVSTNSTIGPAQAFESPPSLAAEHSRVTFGFGEVTIDPATLAEFCQPGAFLETSIAASSEVGVFVGGELAARATLGVTKGEGAWVATIL